MNTARAAVAGMLATVAAIWLHGSAPTVERDEVIVLLLLVAVVVILVVPDALEQWRRRR